MKPRVLICVLCGPERTDWINPFLHTAILRMCQDTRFELFFEPICGLRPWERARNAAFEKANALNPDWCVQFDNDVVPYGNPLDVIAAARDNQRVIGLTYGALIRSEYRPTNSYEGRTEFLEVDYVAGGALMVHSSVWNKLHPPYFAMHIELSEERSYGEDIFFCKQARKAGFKVWTHRQMVGHLKTVDLTRMIVDADRLSKSRATTPA